MLTSIANFFSTLIGYVSTAVSFLVGIVESFIKFVHWISYAMQSLFSFGGINLLIPIWGVLSLVIGIFVLIRVLELI